MRIGIISDIHGNITALDAVLRDIDKDAVDSLVCLGDLAFKGPAPQECVRKVQSLGIPCVQGNTDLNLLTVTEHAATHDRWPKRAPDIHERPYLRWHTARMAAADLDYLADLPFSYRMAVDGQRLLFVHGTPQDCFAAIQPTDAADSMDAAMREADADWIVMGHIHQPFAFRHRHVTLVNAGAIGFSLDGDWRASYCVVDTSTLSVCLRRVEYDIEQAVELARQVNFCFNPEWYGDALRRGWWEPIPYPERTAIDRFPS